MDNLIKTMAGIVDTANSRIGGDMSFETDLEFGKDAEKTILDRVRKKYPLAFMIEGKHKAYDIFVPEKNMGIEIKCDRQAEQTGNAFIEIECNKTYSGIITTTAEWLVYKTSNRTFWIKTKELRDYLIAEAKELPMFNSTPRGETSSVRGYLVPVQDFKLLSFSVENTECLT